MKLLKKELRINVLLVLFCLIILFIGFIFFVKETNDAVRANAFVVLLYNELDIGYSEEKTNKTIQSIINNSKQEVTIHDENKGENIIPLGGFLGGEVWMLAIIFQSNKISTLSIVRRDNSQNVICQKDKKIEETRKK